MNAAFALRPDDFFLPAVLLFPRDALFFLAMRLLFRWRPSLGALRPNGHPHRMNARPSSMLPKHARIVNDFSIDNRHHRPDSSDLIVGHGEVVVAQDGQVGQLPDLDRAELLLHPQEPSVLPRAEPKRVLPGDPLVAVDRLASRVDARRRVIQMEPRVER